MDPRLTELQSSLKRATSAEDAWQQTAAFLSRLSGETTRNIFLAIDTAGGKTVFRVYGGSSEPSENPGIKRPETQIMWLFVDPSLTNSINSELPPLVGFLKNQLVNFHPLLGTILTHAHTRIRALKQKERARKAGITPREKETLMLLARGLRSDKIAHRMGIKRVTVNLHISNARRKFDAATREQALALAVYLGIITP